MGRWARRIVGEAEVSPDELIANDANWRRHPRAQSQAMLDVMERIGWVQRVIVNRRTGRIIDGHMRVRLAKRHGEDTIPVLFVDLPEDEERAVVLAFDSIGAMAEVDEATLDRLIAEVAASGDGLGGLLDALGHAAAVDTDELLTSASELYRSVFGDDVGADAGAGDDNGESEPVARAGGERVPRDAGAPGKSDPGAALPAGGRGATGSERPAVRLVSCPRCGFEFNPRGG